MAFIHFYNGKSLAHASDQTNNIINLSYTIGLNGSVGGEVTLEETTTNSNFLKSLKENSHFIKFGLVKTYGGIVESVSKNKNIYTIKFIGAYEYFDKMDAIASHKADAMSGAAYDTDQSFVKVFYSDSSVGILYESLRNLSESITARGYSADLFDYSNIRNSIVGNNTSVWGRSYRLNSLETPTMRDVVEDIIGDDGMQLFRIRVSNKYTEDFMFIIEIVESSNYHTVSESGDSVFKVRQEMNESQSRAFSTAKGTDLKDRSVIERVDFDENVAYSSLLTENPQEKSAAIRRFASSAAVTASATEGTLSFDSFSDIYDPLDYLSISSLSMAEVSGIVTEKVVEGEVITYTIQVGPTASFNAAISKPSGELRRIIFNPLSRTSKTASKTAGRKENSTGWRS